MADKGVRVHLGDSASYQATAGEIDEHDTLLRDDFEAIDASGGNGGLKYQLSRLLKSPRFLCLGSIGAVIFLILFFSAVSKTGKKIVTVPGQPVGSPRGEAGSPAAGQPFYPPSDNAPQQQVPQQQYPPFPAQPGMIQNPNPGQNPNPAQFPGQTSPGVGGGMVSSPATNVVSPFRGSCTASAVQPSATTCMLTSPDGYITLYNTITVAPAPAGDVSGRPTFEETGRLSFSQGGSYPAGDVYFESLGPAYPVSGPQGTSVGVAQYTLMGGTGAYIGVSGGAACVGDVIASTNQAEFLFVGKLYLSGSG